MRNMYWKEGLRNTNNPWITENFLSKTTGIWRYNHNLKLISGPEEKLRICITECAQLWAARKAVVDLNVCHSHANMYTSRLQQYGALHIVSVSNLFRKICVTLAQWFPRLYQVWPKTDRVACPMSSLGPPPGWGCLSGHKFLVSLINNHPSHVS